MNAASILKFLIIKKFIRIKKNDILEITKLVGSDVILGMYSNNLILTSNNKIKKFFTKKKFHVLLVKPNFGCSTKKIYSGVQKFSPSKLGKININKLNHKSFNTMSNDLEIVALKRYPKLKNLKIFLEKLSQVKFVRMTGSGSTLIAYFLTNKKCKDAEKKVKNKFKNYWCKIAKTI